MRGELKILLVTSAFTNLAAGLLGPLYALFVEEIGGGVFMAGSSYAAYALAAGILMFFVSRWEDRIDHQERLVIAGHAIGTAGYVGFLLVSEPWHLYLVQTLMGIGTAIKSPAYDSVYSKYLDDGKYASEWGLWESEYWLTVAAAGVMGGWLADSYGFSVLISVMLGLSILGLITVVQLLRTDAPQQEPAPTDA